MKRFVPFLILLSLWFSWPAAADIITTGTIVYPGPSTCTVNWLDTLGYKKPLCQTVAKPTEATATKKWVDLGSGSGSACTSASPCSLSTALSGISRPAYVYLRGSGGFGDPTISGGSAGNEIVFAPWNDSTSATITGRNNWAAAKSWIIFDGGQNLQLKVILSGANQFDPSIYFNATASTQHDIVFYRVQWHVTNAGEHVASFGGWNNLWFVNNEFWDTGASDTANQHHVYLSGCNGGVTLSNLHVIANIFRDTPGEAMELRAAGSGTVLSNFEIRWNAFHDVGKGTCNNSWHCRSAITIVEDGTGCAGTQAGTFSGTFEITNNLVWDIGENIFRVWDFPATGKIMNNTAYNWGALGSDSVSGTYPAYGFMGSSSPYTYTGVYTGNILYATGSFNGAAKSAFYNSGSATRTFNACVSGQTCGTSNQAITAASFLSLDENNINFLKVASGATPINNGTSGACFSPDYFGTVRPIGTCDIGAQEQ